MEIRLDGKVALVTGSSSGIGQGIAERLAECGADVMINYYGRREGADHTAEMVRAAGRRAEIFRADVGDPQAVGAMFAALDQAFGRIDILVNNAGIGAEGMLLDLGGDSWERVMRTNLTGPFLCAQQAGRRMRDRGEGGRIVNISSVHEEAPGVAGGVYHVSKGGLRNLTRALALELSPEGILVTDVAPGMILTPMNQQALEDPAYLSHAEGLIPARRAGLPEDIANMVCFLCSDAGSYVTGSTVFVDGGWMLEWPPV